jgi:hypothetical protein
MPTSDNSDLLASLQSLRPAATSIDRDRLLHEAGRRSVRQPRSWQAATLVSGMLALGTALAWHWSPATVHDRFVYVPTPAASTVANHDPVPEPIPPGSYHELRDTALRTGAFALPAIELDPPARPVLTAGSYADSADTPFLTGRIR